MLKFDLSIQKNFEGYSNIPVCNTIKKILIGKLFNFHCNKTQFVILAVRRNNLYGYLEILIGKFWGSSINVYSWYCYNPKHDMQFIGRSNKQTIRNCLKRNPKYIKYHIGKSINIDDYPIYDNCNYYEDHKKSVNF
jgi:hypothetical protein